MCEWLSREEWCDVQLLCSGRAFSAHRAVLASVSTFLRRTLLSCPIEEAQTYIVLPDFDVDAMSSVLHYVYNGEVIIAKQNLQTFLEIVTALQIFVDQTFLNTISGTINDTDKYLYMFNYEDSYRSKENAFILSSTKRKHQQYITLKKGQQFMDITSQYSVLRSDISSKQVRCQNWIEHVPYLENVQSSHEDRQRDSSLRDSFIETYPRNGKANGRTVGVPVISNERYREPTSALLTNANGKHLTAVDAFSALPKTLAISNVKSLHQNAHGIFHDVRLDNTQTEISNKVENSEFNMKSLLENSVPEKPSITGLSGCELKSSFGMFPLGLTECSLTRNYMKSLDLRVGNVINDTVQHQIWSTGNCSKTAEIGFKDFHTDSCKMNQICVSNNLAKVAILNKATESPWCSRIPLNYKPFRRKEHTNTRATKENAAKFKNDDNNNLEDTKTVEIKLDLDNTKNFKNGTKEILNNSYSIDSLIAKDNFECTVCNQVFTSNESLSTHMRRHTSARYSCAECGKTFSQLRNYKYHMSVHRGTREFAATCSVCGKYFNDRGYLSSHMKIHRNRKEYKCSMCPKSFNQRVAYNMHVRIHTGVKPHVCGECGKAFSRKMLLKQHQRTHSGERPYACAHCGKRFADRSNMTLHLRLHTGIKPFSCTLCPKSFTKKHHLKSHLNFHTGAKPYSCPRCKLGFTQSSNMRTHLKKCNAPDPASTSIGIDPNKVQL